MNKTLILALSIILLVISNIRCTSGGNQHNSTNNDSDTLITDTSKVRPIYNVYVETSGSMMGYLTDGSEFYHDITSIISNINSLEKDSTIDSLNLYYLGNQVFNNDTGKKLITDFNRKLNKNLIAYPVNESDFYTFLDSILNNVSKKEVAIFITDYIFSPSEKVEKENILNFLQNQSRGIQDRFSTKLNDLDFSTLVLKFESNFTGTYTDYLEKPHVVYKIKRPYYVTVIGASPAISVFVDKINYENLMGYKRKLFFSGTISIPRNPKVVKYQKIGQYEFEKPATKLSITQAKAKDGVFKFAIAVDFSKIVADNEYLIDTSNYKALQNSSNYKVVQVKEITDYTNKSIQGYTHILILQTKELKSEQEISFELTQNIPYWVAASSNKDDKSIETNSKQQSTTFGFYDLIEGVHKAYLLKYQSRPFASFKIYIKK